MPFRVSPIPLDDQSFVGFGDCPWMVSKQRRPWLTGRATNVNVSCAVLLLVRLRLVWKRFTCWNSPKCFTLSVPGHMEESE